MKTKRVLVFGLSAVLLALSASLTMGLAGCDTGGEPGAGTNNTDQLKFFLSGSFGDKGKLDLQVDDDSPGLSASVMASTISESDNSYPLTGVLEDGDILLRLRGSYDPGSGNWSVSARSVNDVIYTIDGSGGYDGEASFLGAGATIVEPDAENPDEWAPAFAPVTRSAAAFDLTEGAPGKADGGMPSFARGYWNGNWEKDIDGVEGGKIITSVRGIISEWKIKIIGSETREYPSDGLDRLPDSVLIDQNQTIIEVSPVEGESNTYMVISCYPEYVPTAENYAKALSDWLGLDEVIPVHTIYPNEPPEGRWLYSNNFDLLPVCVNFPDTDLEMQIAFYAANGWEQWAAKNDVEPVKRYAQYKFVFDGDNGFDMVRMIGWPEDAEEQSDNPSLNYYTYDSLAELKAADLHEEHKFYIQSANAIGIDTGVFEMPFTR
jgi:hypothetical protein